MHPFEYGDSAFFHYSTHCSRQQDMWQIGKHKHGTFNIIKPPLRNLHVSPLPRPWRAAG